MHISDFTISEYFLQAFSPIIYITKAITAIIISS